MPRPRNYSGGNARRSATSVLAVAAVLSLVALTGLALAKSFTLKVRKHVAVTNTATGKTTKKTIVVNGHGVSVYYLAPETTQHPLCTKANGCFSFWPPLKVSGKGKPTASPDVPKGKLGVWHRNGFAQVTWKGHPLYRFRFDHNKPGVATGDHLSSFNGTWHVVPAK